MASYNGILQPSPIYQEAAGYNDGVSNTIASRTWELIQHDGNPDSFNPLVQSVHTINAPVDMLELAWNGVKVGSFLDDYYYRIHVNPADIALGAVLSPIQETFVVWNAWFISKDCSSIVKTNPNEFVLTGNTAPFSLEGLGYTTYTIDVSEEGSVEFVSTITFVFPDSSPVLTLSATRVQVFPFSPLNPMTETLQWLTSILTAKDGSEQRISLRPVPRQAFVLRFYLATEEEQARFDALLFGWQKKTWGIPVWQENVLHTATINADDLVINLDTTTSDFRDDSFAIIWQNFDSYEVVKISTVAAGSLTLEEGVANTWTGTKWILPLRISNMVTQSRKQAKPDSNAIIDCTFLITDNVLLTGHTPPVTHDGIEVIGPSYVEKAESEEEISDADFVMVDYGLAKIDFFSDSAFNKLDKSQHFKRFTKTDCWNFRQFLHSLFGKRGVVWIPSFKADLTLTQTIGAADTSFNVKNVGFADHMGANALRTHLAFSFPDGTVLYREITGIAESGNEEIFSIDSSLGVQVNVGDCEISFLDKYRLGSDEIEMDWETNSELSCKTNFVRVSE